MNILDKNEKSANSASAKVMRITAAVFILVLVLNIVGIFVIPVGVMVVSFVIGAVLLLIPTLLVNVLKKDSSAIKYIISLCAVLFVVDITITLAPHAVLMYVYPIAIASLYFSKRLNNVITVLTAIGVTAGQLVAFKLRPAVTADHNFDDLKECILFGIVPRVLILFAISAIFTMLCKRTTNLLGSLMSAEQQELMREKSREMSATMLKTVTELDRISVVSAENNRSISSEAQSITQSTEKNTSNIALVERSVAEISQSLNNLSEMSAQIASLSASSDKLAVENNEFITSAYGEMQEICDSTDKCKELMTHLAEHSQQITGIVKTITDISTQTNILAINASIESAHAGAAGKGFAVVAGDVKRLALQSQEAAASIGEIIGIVAENISETAKGMEKNAALTRNSMNSMEKLKDSAAQISASNKNIAENIAEINRNIESAAQNGESVSSHLSEVTSGIRGNSEAMGQVTASIKENVESTQSLAGMVKDIAEFAAELQKLCES